MATCTWTGASSNLWNVAGNWDTLPSAGDDLVFPSSASNKSNSNNFTADTAFNSITLNGTGYTLAGNRITLGAGGITQTTGTNTISLAIILGANVTVSVAGTTLTLSGIISETGGARSLAKTGTSQLVLSGANTFTGGLTIKAGTCNLATSTSAGGGSGTGTITLGDTSGSANATLAASSSLTFANPITVASGSSGTLAISGYGVNVTWSGAITLANNLHITQSSANIVLSGGTAGTGNVINTGGAGSSALYISTTAPNHVGGITNSGVGIGALTITVAPGANVTAVTQNSNTSELVFIGATLLTNCGGKLQITKGTIRFLSSYTVTNLFVDATGCTDKTAQLVLAANQTVTGEFKVRGSGVNRLLVTSETLGTARTITVTGATISNSQAVDFRDITFANGGSNVNLSAITGGSGDCGGNTISGGGVLSFTTADDWYWYSASGGTYNLSDRTYWFTATNGGGTQMGADRGPLPQDMLYVDGSSINGTTTIDQDMPRMPGIDFTGCDAVALRWYVGMQRVYGSLVAPATVTATGGPGVFVYFENRSPVLLSWVPEFRCHIYIRAIGGSVILGYDLYSQWYWVLEYGLFDADQYDVAASQLSLSGTNSKELRMGSGTWTARFSIWNFSATTGLVSTLVGETSTIITGEPTSTQNRAFGGGGLTYNNLSIIANTSGTQQITISGNNTFNSLTINGPKTINFTAGSVQTVAEFKTTGTGIVLKSTTLGSPWYLVDASGTNQVSNATISDSYPRGSDAGGGALWLASDGTNTDAGGNVAYDGMTNRGWKWLPSFMPWAIKTLLQRIR